MTLPDVTADIQLAANEGNTFSLDQDSAVSAEIEIQDPNFEYRGCGNWLMPVPGTFKTGDAIFRGREANGWFFEKLWIEGSVDPIGIAVFMPNSHLPGPVFKNTILKNLGHADPVHFDCDGMVIENYVYTENTPGIHFGGLVGGSAGVSPKNVKIKDAVSTGTLELDGSMDGGYIEGSTFTDCLIGVSVGPESWNGHKWKHNHFGPRPGQPVLQFSPAPSGRKVGGDWTIEDCTFDLSDGGIINHPELFAGTWGKGNTPATI